MCATSKRIRLRPPPLVSGPHCGLQGGVCGGNETIVLLGPHRHLHYETLTTTGAPGMSISKPGQKTSGISTGGRQRGSLEQTEGEDEGIRRR
ncbi:hypothetical protein EYF80_040010 [Liparis tanakae]|uniref:Uncharacterized protein n=1 Tax=Liparis tanakae TaxID=230148 RepID=A0A4Z2G8C0_9TELE|nr:hypothetical protein EYF80_040010 [Liparis tanakae]